MRLQRIMALAVALMLVLVPAAAFAADGVNVALDKNNYSAGEEIHVTVTGVTEQMAADWSWASVYEAGAPHESYGSWTRLDVGTNEVTFTAPGKAGEYEIRVYKFFEVYTDEAVAAKAGFTVGRVQKQGGISLARSSYAARETIPVTVTEISKEMEAAGAWVGIYRAGGEHRQWENHWAYVKEGNSTVEIEAPNTNGNFEMRLYAVENELNDETLVAIVPFSLSGAVAEQPVSDWAVDEISRAAEMGLIPTSCKQRT